MVGRAVFRKSERAVVAASEATFPGLPRFGPAVYLKKVVFTTIERLLQLPVLPTKFYDLSAILSDCE